MKIYNSNYDNVKHIFLTMQWNYASPFLPNVGYDPFSIGKAPLYPQIIGEGDVKSVVLPDGTIQFFFVPTNRYINLSPFQMNTNHPNHCTANKDIWFVRSITHPLAPSLLNRQFPNVYGDQQPQSQFNPNCCLNSPPSPEYYQKFHNDDSTSTTDIHYFYPSLRNNGPYKCCDEVQTEPLAIKTALGQVHCGCKSAEASSTSYMSIDSASKSRHRLTKKNKKKSKSNNSRYFLCECNLRASKSKHKTNKSRDSLCKCNLEASKSKYKTNKNRHSHCECNLEAKKSKYKTNKSRDSLCECNLEAKKSKYKTNKSRDSLCECNLEASKSKHKTHKSRQSHCECNLEAKKSKYKTKKDLCKCDLETKETSDKILMTFAEKASGGIVSDGRHTQTNNNTSKGSDIKTELWIPIDRNSSTTLKLLSSGQCSDSCCYRSTSETEY